MTPKQQKLADRFLEGKSQAEAHKLAGYSGKNDAARSASACEILKKPNVAAYIEEQQARAAERAVLSTAHFARRLERIAAAAERRAVVEVTDDETGDTYEVIASKDAADVARQCSMSAAQLLGLVIDRKELKGSIRHNVADLSRDELYAIATGSGEGASPQRRGARQLN